MSFIWKFPFIVIPFPVPLICYPLVGDPTVSFVQNLVCSTFSEKWQWFFGKRFGDNKFLKLQRRTMTF